jgi:hypothetical protein
MRKLLIISAGLILGSNAAAENLAGVDEMICSAGQAQICLETGDCYAATPWELSVPDFVVINTKKKTISTTKASGLNRSTEFSKVEKSEGLIYLQGIDSGRAFSFVIDEITGRMTVAVSRDGLSVTVFGACTDTDI